MELILRDLRIGSLKDHLKMCREHCEFLKREFEAALAGAEQTNLAFAWDAATKHGHMVEFLLGILQRREQEGRPAGGTQHIRLSAHRHRASASNRRVAYPDVAAFKARNSSSAAAS